ncbi:MAG: DUF4837 family protein [bacterium]
MHKIIVFLLGLILISCNSNSNDQLLLSSSSGNINDLNVVIDNQLWEGEIGDLVRQEIAAPVYGLPQEEPLFSIRQMPPQVFTGFARNNRTILIIEKGEEDIVSYKKNVFAKPQTVIFVRGTSNASINELIKKDAQRIIATFKKTELNEKQRRIGVSLNKDNNISKVLNLRMKFPSAYRVAKEEGSFFWLRRDIKTGTLNVMLYDLPLDAISESDTLINTIIRKRDSIGKTHIPGPIDGSFMITERAYTPFMGKTSIDDKTTYETKSTWEVKNAFMAGPFLNYAIKDEVNNRWIIAEGFTYAPSVEKRDYMFELESILKSIEIQ